MGVYVLYYHRIYPEGPADDVTLPLFDWEMKYIKKRYQILSLTDLIDYINGDLALERPGVAITFDDGWFDNFVYAWPVLKKYGLKATIFVSTGKIRNENIVRPTLDDCWRKALSIDNLQKPESAKKGFVDSLYGNFNEFLSWEELRVMQRSGVIDVQSHGVEHRRIFCGDKPKGTATDKVSWSVLSASPDIKEGMPIYPVRSALAARAYYPDFSGGHGRWETEDDMRKRILAELVESRDRIHSEIGFRPLHFCWPWGQYSEVGIELAKKAGYEVCYTTKAGTITTDTDRLMVPRVSTKGGKLTFIKRGLVYSNPYISKAYGFLKK